MAETRRRSATAAPLADEPISTALRSTRSASSWATACWRWSTTAAKGLRLTDQIRALRRQLAAELGFVMPSVRIQDNMQLPADSYVIRVKEIEAGRGEVRPAMLLAMDPRGEPIALPGEKTKEPTFGLPALWMDAELSRGSAVPRPDGGRPGNGGDHPPDRGGEGPHADLLSYAETRKLLDELDKDHQKLVADLIPTQISIGGLQRVLQNLLAERISIRDLPTILEGISEACGHTRNITQITEHVRARLARQISSMYTNDDGYIPLLTLAPEWEQTFAESLAGPGDDRQLAIAPASCSSSSSRCAQAYDRQAQAGETPILLTSPTIRPYVRSIVERFRPASAVISQSEIFAKARIKTVGRVA